MTRAFIIATGPSLTWQDCERVKNVAARIYTVNDAFRWFPHVDVIYACDEEWWDVHEAATRGRGVRWTCSDAAAGKYGLRHIPGQHHHSAGVRFDASGQGIVYGGNSGFQALNLAFAHGLRDAVLLGFDMGHDQGRPSHFFGEHPPSIAKPSPYAAWLRHFYAAAPEIRAAGMTVVNATRGGWLDAFPRVQLEDVL